MKPTLYTVLGITPEADCTIITRAYDARLREAQCNPQVDVMTFAQAYYTLIDPGRRVAYDFALRRAVEVIYGYDATYEVTITPEEAQAGTTRTLIFHGADGHEQHIVISIPPNTGDSTSICIPSAGGPSMDGQQRGTLIIIVRVYW